MIQSAYFSNFGSTALENTVKISKRDLVDILYYWLSEHLTEKEVKAMANEVGLNLKGFFRIMINKKLYAKFYGELFVLNMCLIVFTCETVIEDEDDKKEILSIFHSTVYERNVKVTGISYRKWITLMELIYNEYRNAMEAESLLIPLLLLANKFCNNLFGEAKLDAFVKFEFAMRVGGIAKQLSKTLREYDIEH